MVTVSLHILALALYLGFAVALLVIMLPATTSVEPPEEGAELLVRSLRIYNPAQIAALGILVLTGAWQVTDLKDLYRASYATEFGSILGIKLAVSFIIIMLGTYQCMGVGHRFVRLYEGDAKSAVERMSSVVRKLGSASILIIPFTVYAVYLGIRL